MSQRPKERYPCGYKKTLGSLSQMEEEKMGSKQSDLVAAAGPLSYLCRKVVT